MWGRCAKQLVPTPKSKSKDGMQASARRSRMTEAVIVGAVRTPMGRHHGILKDVRPDDLAALVVGEVVRRAGLDPALIEEVYLGCANQAGEDNRNVARMAALLAGFPVSVAGVTLNRLCASGLAAINAAARAIKADEGDVFVAGGVESMTRAPYAIPKNQDGGMGNLTAWDTTLGWRFPNPRLKAKYGNEAMGETAENLREGKPTISREEQDRFALESHRRAIAAIESGKFAEEIVPVPLPSTTGEARTGSRDEPPRADTCLEALAKRRPARREMGRRAPRAPRPYHGLATLCVGVGQGEATVVEWAGG